MNDTSRLSWEDLLKQIVRNPNLLDRMGSADLKRVGKMLCQTIEKVGIRAAHAEQNLDQVTARCLELTGGRPPAWSYLHEQEAHRLHEFTGFTTLLSEETWIVCGDDPDGNTMHPIYEYDLADFEPGQAESQARIMTAHLRQTFCPRTKEKPV